MQNSPKNFVKRERIRKEIKNSWEKALRAKIIKIEKTRRTKITKKKTKRRGKSLKIAIKAKRTRNKKTRNIIDSIKGLVANSI